MSAGETRLLEHRYTAYHGERRGRLAAVWSLARWSALTALGARRGWRAKVIPGFLIAVAALPALIDIGLKALIPEFSRRFPDLIPYARYYTETGITVLFFAGLITPELLCPDRRDRVLSLYFSTALSRTEYVLGKMLGALLPLAAVTTLPVVFLYLGNVVFADHPLGYVENHLRDALCIVVAGTFLSLYFGLLGLAIASLTTRRAFAMGGYIGLIVIAGATTGVLVNAVNVGEWARLLALGRNPLVAARGLFGGQDAHPGGVSLWAYWAVCLGVIAFSALVLWWRYRPGAEE